MSKINSSSGKTSASPSGSAEHPRSSSEISGHPDIMEVPSTTRARAAFLWTVGGSAGLISVVLAWFILMGGDEKGLMTALLVLLADVFLVVGFFARHAWLRAVSWITTALMVVAGSVAIWVENYTVILSEPYPPDWGGGMNEVTWSYLLDAVAGASILVAGFVALMALISLVWKRLTRVGWARMTYTLVFTLLAVSGMVYAVAIVLSTLLIEPDYLYRFATALLVLAGTGAASLIIVALSSRRQEQAPVAGSDARNAGAPVGSVPEPSGNASAIRSDVPVDFESPAARSAFLKFMKEYEAGEIR